MTIKGYRSFAFILLLAVPLGTTGCASWRPYEAGAGFTDGRTLPYRVRATRPDSSRIDLTAPFVQGDSLYGRISRDTVGLPLAEVVHLERERLSPERTAALVIGLPAVALGVTYLIVCSLGCDADY